MEYIFCPFCGMRLLRQRTYAQHTKRERTSVMHTITCKLDGITFRDGRGYKSHMRSKHPGVKVA